MTQHSRNWPQRVQIWVNLLFLGILSNWSENSSLAGVGSGELAQGHGVTLKRKRGKKDPHGPVQGRRNHPLEFYYSIF